jgi:acetylornithine deacetylase/succinyl-diaminopimelate desuccinylase-like protein
LARPGSVVKDLAARRDGKYLNQGGIPTYGLSGRFFRPGDHHNHGLNEHIPVRSLYEARDFLYEITKLYTNAS